MRDAFDKRRPQDADAKDREIARLREEVARKSRITAEVVEENLQLKTTL